MLDDIVRFKLHVQRSLEDYEQFIADEVERSYKEHDLIVDDDDDDDDEMAEESS
jgi:kinetochore protein NDC80